MRTGPSKKDGDLVRGSVSRKGVKKKKALKGEK